ncbi:MAG: hypothetical protein KJO76_09150 [Gammaproteobacteria bacterium]|nr:hypothetical protein [Gammaproteobacteria bacterium]
MLEKNAPALPVPGCDVDKCGCRYQKFADRRSGAERRLPFGGALVNQFGAYDMVERKGADRRAGRRKARPRAYFNDYD